MAKERKTVTSYLVSLDTQKSKYASISYSQGALNSNAASSTFATITTKTGAGVTTSLYYNFDFSSIPLDATIISVEAKYKVALSGVVGVQTKNARLMSGEDLKGGAVGLTTSREDNQAIPDVGEWTAAELQNAIFRIVVVRSSSGGTNKVTVAVYGVEMTVVYELPETDTLYFKDSGAWTAAEKAYKKANGVWVEQTDLTTVFDAGKSWVKG